MDNFVFFNGSKMKSSLVISKLINSKFEFTHLKKVQLFYKNVIIETKTLKLLTNIFFFLYYIWMKMT